MDQARPTRKLLDWRPMGTRPVGRPRQRWQEDVVEDLKKLKYFYVEKIHRIKWLGHIQGMDQATPTNQLLDWRPMATRPVGRPRQRWQEDVMEDLKKLKVKKKTGRRQQRTEELGETWLRR